MNILNIAKYYTDNILNPQYQEIIKNTITRNSASILNQIQIILNNQAERERAIEEIDDAMKNDPEATKKTNTRRFGFSEIMPLKNQKQIMRFQTEDLTSRGILKIRTNMDDSDLNMNIISKFYPEEQNLIITLILENIIDEKNTDSYSYTIEYILLTFEENIVQKLTALDTQKINIILLSSVRTLISYTIAYGIFLEEIQEHTTENYIKYIESKEEYTTIKDTILFMNQT